MSKHYIVETTTNENQSMMYLINAFDEKQASNFIELFAEVSKIELVREATISDLNYFRENDKESLMVH